MCRCLILLSTYNGEKYLPELLESVLAQKDIYVDILARDVVLQIKRLKY